MYKQVRSGTRSHDKTAQLDCLGMAKDVNWLSHQEPNSNNKLNNAINACPENDRIPPHAADNSQ
jgi:hypothetical protein